ncbi:MAG: hypothetical protein EBX39_03670 [Actinobacteria bacterium]|nr:hypothetical protein [Actinomycetota bacterium]
MFGLCRNLFQIIFALVTHSIKNNPDLVEPAARLLASAIDTGDGGTAEQRRVLDLVVHNIWHRPDIDISALAPMSVEEAEIFRSDEVVHRRLRMFLVLLELCRHPLTAEQVARVDAYAAAIGEYEDAGLAMARDLVGRSREEAAQHFFLAWSSSMTKLSEAVLVERFEQIGAVDPELATMLRKMGELPRGTLGREYVEFYMEYKFQFPGDGVSNPAFFVAHDMTHLIAGFGPSAPEEVALSAMQLAMNDSDEHWMLFLTSMAAFEIGISSGTTDFQAKDGILLREGAAELIHEGFERGTRCTGDFSIADHLSMAHLPIAQIREMFSVPAPSVPFPAFIGE